MSGFQTVQSAPLANIGGGLMPGQQGLADFTFGEGELKNAASFGNTGTGASTMSSMGAAGPQFDQALLTGEMSHNDIIAQQNFLNQQFQAQQQANQVKQSNTGSLIGGLGSLAGGGI